LAESSKKLTFSEIKEIVKSHLKTALGIETFNITFASFDEQSDMWRISVSYVTSDKNAPPGLAFRWPNTAILRLKASTGDVVEFRDGFSYSQ
jgi:hypothetical protein